MWRRLLGLSMTTLASVLMLDLAVHVLRRIWLPLVLMAGLVLAGTVAVRLAIRNSRDRW